MKTVRNLITIVSIILLSTNICWGQDVQVDRTDSIWGANMFLSENQDSIIVTFYTSADLKVYDYVQMRLKGLVYYSYVNSWLSGSQVMEGLKVSEQKLSYSSLIMLEFPITCVSDPYETIEILSFELLHPTEREERPIRTNTILYYREQTSLNMIRSDEGQYERRYFSLKGEEYSNLDFKDNIYITAIYNENKLVKTFKSYKK